MLLTSARAPTASSYDRIARRCGLPSYRSTQRLLDTVAKTINVETFLQNPDRSVAIFTSDNCDIKPSGGSYVHLVVHAVIELPFVVREKYLDQLSESFKEGVWTTGTQNQQSPLISDDVLEKRGTSSEGRMCVYHGVEAGSHSYEDISEIYADFERTIRSIQGK